MPLIATLISNSAERNLTSSLTDMAARATGATTIHWLADAIACDLQLPEGSELKSTDSALRAAIGDHPIDVVVQEAATRRKRILIADMDSTMIDQECIDELADEIGVKDFVADITRRSMNGEIPFDVALRERVALLAGLDSNVVDRIVKSRLTLAAGGKALVSTMRASGAWTALVSGGFTVFTSKIAAMLGFDENQANVLLENDGHLIGKVAEPILGREAKAAALREMSSRLGLTPADAIAVGDGANDLDMLAIAGTGVALHAKPIVAAQAQVRIDHSDLTALLYMQGYRQDDIIQ